MLSGAAEVSAARRAATAPHGHTVGADNGVAAVNGVRLGDRRLDLFDAGQLDLLTAGEQARTPARMIAANR